jgi:hypothetical protein
VANRCDSVSQTIAKIIVTAKTNRAELEGSLHQFHLTDVVQLLHAGGKTGELVLAHTEGALGSIFFEDGAIVHVRSGSLAGEEAFFALMRLTDGHFSFTPDRRSQERTVDQNSTMLLLEGVRRSDEWGVFQEAIPDLDSVPEFLTPSEQDSGQQVTLNTSEWIVLSRIDGRRSVRDIAKESALNEFHVCRLLYPLLQNRLIRLLPPVTSPS